MLTFGLSFMKNKAFLPTFVMTTLVITIIANVIVISHIKKKAGRSKLSPSPTVVTIWNRRQVGRRRPRLDFEDSESKASDTQVQRRSGIREKGIIQNITVFESKEDRKKGYYTNETLRTVFGTRLLKPGTKDEAAAGRLMHIRKHKIINPHDYKYSINPAEICSNRSVEVVLCVVSAIDNFKLRSKFRYSIKGGYAGIWNDRNKAVLLFFVGQPPPQETATQHKLDMESSKNKDIVQADFVDSYRNLSLKTVSILKWVSTYCSNAQFVIKTDDDCDVNIPLMMTELHRKQLESPLFMLGKVSRKLTPIRKANSKWFVSKSLYKEDKFPEFLYGGSQGYPTIVARLLYEAAQRMPTFYLEDVYVSGLCARMANIPRFDKVAFYFTHFPPPEETEY